MRGMHTLNLLHANRVALDSCRLLRVTTQELSRLVGRLRLVKFLMTDPTKIRVRRLCPLNLMAFCVDL